MKYYITTTLPYVNADPHIGFALEIVQADVLARYHRQNGDDVFFNTGTDEHGLKIYRKAKQEKKDVQKYCDEYAAKFDDLKNALNLSYNNFIRTTDEHHVQAAQEFWRRCAENGDIYKKNYKVRYCVGCELNKTDSELIDNRCPEHPESELEIIEEENYFFRYSNYQDKLLELYKNNPDFVVPDFRLNEIKKFTRQGLEDFSISRLKEKMPWGVPVPGDENHVMYVWFDALVNYISAIGWPEDEKKYKDFWPGVQVAGKDNLRQQASMWQAMLLSAGLEPSKQILIHGFINSNGQKMSKSLGNVIDPFVIVDKYGTDALRYYLLAEITPFEDGDFTVEKFEHKYNADLANGLGNLVARVSNLIEKNNIILDLTQNVLFCHPRAGGDPVDNNSLPRPLYSRFRGNDKREEGENICDIKLRQNFNAKMQAYKFNEALAVLWKKLRECDETITKQQPWKLDNPDDVKKVLEPVAQTILNVAELLQPFLPDTSAKIIKIFTAEKIKKAEILFPRI